MVLEIFVPVGKNETLVVVEVLIGLLCVTSTGLGERFVVVHVTFAVQVLAPGSIVQPVAESVPHVIRTVAVSETDCPPLVQVRVNT